MCRAQAPATPATPREVADFFIRLLTAKQVDVKTLLAASPAELPFFRLRLYVAPTVSGESWAGVDSNLFRSSGEACRVELALPKGLFRDSLNTACRDPRSILKDRDEAGVRLVDVWCRHSGNAGGHVPLMAKVRFNTQPDAQGGEGPMNAVSGRLCHDDLPELLECLQLLDASQELEQQDTQTLSAASDAVDTLAQAIEVHRADIASFHADMRGNPTKTSSIPGGESIEVMDTEGLPEAMCVYEQMMTRSLPSGVSFIGLAPGSLTGMAAITLELPFPGGGGAVWAPARIADETAILQVEASSDGREWTRLYRLDAATMRDEGQHVLPASILGASTIKIRARLTSRDGAGTPVGDRGLRFLIAGSPFPGSFGLECGKDSLRLIRREQSPADVRSQLRLVVQPAVLDARAISACVGAGSPEVDVYAPCELDKDACRDIGNYGGVIRFWSPVQWQAVSPEWQAEMVAGAGWLIFPRMKELTEASARALAGGKKSLSFPEVSDPRCEVLDALARCSGELALDGVRTLSAEQSAVISRYGGARLSLAGLHAATLPRRPPDAVLKAVVEAPGTCTLSGVTELDEATATLLVAGQKHLVLDDVVSLSASVAAILSRTDKGLSLNGIRELDQAAAKELLSFSGQHLSLAGLRTVQCGIDDLPAQDGRRVASLRSLLMPPRTAADEAEASRKAAMDELEVMFQEAVALGIQREENRDRVFAAASESEEALQEILARNRMEHPQLRPYCKVLIGGTTGTPLDAFVRAPGVFTLRPRGGFVVGKSRFTAAVAQSLARGQKNLQLDCLADRDLSQDVVAALASARTVVSLDGISEVSPELAAPLAKHQGRLLSLQGVSELDEEVGTLFMPLIQDDRVSLSGAGMFNVAALRAFVIDRRKRHAPETPEQKKVCSAFLERSEKQEWAARGRANKGKGEVVLLFPGEVEFDVGGKRVRMRRDDLLKTSRDRLNNLAKDAKEVAEIRKGELLIGVDSAQ